MLEADLPGRHERIVEEALEEATAENWEEAAAILRAEYESVCERENPELGESPHPAACHLHDEPVEATTPPRSSGTDPGA